MITTKRCFALAPLALAILATPAMADTRQEIEALKARLAQLEAMIQAQADAAARQQADLSSVKAQAAAAPAPAAVATAKGPDIAGTKVSFKGYVKVDGLSSRFSEGEVGRVTGRDFYVPNAIPVFSSKANSGSTTGANGKARQVFDMHAKQTRLIVNTDTPNAGGPALKAHVEVDFLSSMQGNEAVSNGYSPELRQAFFSYGNWMAGQAWTTFQDLGALPETVDFVGSADGSVFGRQPQVRYTRGPWQIAVENSQTVTSTVDANATTPGNQPSAAGVESNDTSTPDLIARYTHKGDFGHVSLAALGRQIRVQDNNLSDSATGYGVSLSGKVKAVGDDDVRFMLTHGEGIGRYVALNTANDAVLTPTGELDLIGLTAGYVTYRHVWSEGLRSNFQVAGFFADNPSSASPDATKQVHSGLINLIYNVTPKLEVGIEALHAQRKVEGGAEGSMDRLQVMAKHSF